MPVRNAEIADLFDRMATLLEIQGANPFRVRAYRNAAQTLRGLPRRVADMLAEEEDLSRLPGIGKDLAGKIAELVDTGHFVALEELEKEVPAGLVELTRLAGLGPKRVRVLHEELGIRDLTELERAARKGRIRELAGFGVKTEQRILQALRRHAPEERRHKLADVEETASDYVDHLRAVAGVKDVIVAGSYRRRKETVGDLDILVTCKKGAPVMRSFVEYDEVDEVVSRGTTRATVLLRSGLQVDLRVVPQVSYGAALYYFTGSKAHNVAVRTIAVKKKLKINEYGVYKGDQRVAGKTESEIFKAVGLRYIEPELRENRGEIEAAKKNRLPHLVCVSDIRGDLHAHSDATDGHDSLRKMAGAAKKLGYSYLAITDHSKRVTIAHGMDEKRLRPRDSRPQGRRGGHLSRWDARLERQRLEALGPHRRCHPQWFQPESTQAIGTDHPCDGQPILQHLGSSDGASDQPTTGLRDRHGRRHGSSPRTRLLSRAERAARSPRSPGRPLPHGQGHGSQARHFHGRPQEEQLGVHALWRGPGSPGMARARGRPQHSTMAGAQETAGETLSSRRKKCATARNQRGVADGLGAHDSGLRLRFRHCDSANLQINIMARFLLSVPLLRVWQGRSLAERHGHQ